MHYDVIIIGAGPGGLACAARLARHGISTLVVERKTEIGPKVCAGGITWSGLLRTVPESLIEQSFPCQYVQSRLQAIRVSADVPIIATVNRKNLGRYMAQIALQAGATIQTATSLRHIEDGRVILLDHVSGKCRSVRFEYLIGADGSSSKVRRHLGISTEKIGIGINYQIDGKRTKMEWHLNSRYFRNGYGWIFPHKNTISIGAYLPANALSATQLKRRLCRWALTRGFDLSGSSYSAGYINYDYKGYHFDRYYLIGDAAGFASALTGEGIYPAIITGECVAEKIIDSQCDLSTMNKIIGQQKKFVKVVDFTSKYSTLSAVLAEAGVFALRTKMIDFTMLEMSN
jgi:geranylgeranyl reductase